MDNKWQSISDIKDEFGLSYNEDDNLDILAKLKEKRAELHPDKNGGEFTSEEQRKFYHRVDDAITYLESKIEESKDLIPLSQLPTIIDSITTSIAKQNKPSAIQIQRDLKNDFRSELSRKYITPKIGSGVFAGISAFLFAKAGDFADHPLLSGYLGGETGLMVLGQIFIISSLFFVITWVREKKEEGLASYLMTDSALKQIYSSVKDHMSDECIVTTSDIRNALMFGDRYHHIRTPLDMFFPIRPRLSPEAIDRILELQLSKMLERQVLEEIDKPGLDKSYRVLNNA